MAILPIRIVGDPVLHEPITPFEGDPSELADLIRDMYETMDTANGVGLAANQVGAALRVFVYDCPDDRDVRGSERHRGEVINPVLETSEVPETMPDEEDDVEGCLSVPGEQYPTGRADWARVTGLDRNGEPVTVEGEGFFARCLQHEVGHLDGHLYLDALIGRNKRAAKKMVKRNGWNVPGNEWTPGEEPDPFGNGD